MRKIGPESRLADVWGGRNASCSVYVFSVYVFAGRRTGVPDSRQTSLPLRIAQFS